MILFLKEARRPTLSWENQVCFPGSDHAGSFFHTLSHVLIRILPSLLCGLFFYCEPNFLPLTVEYSGPTDAPFSFHHFGKSGCHVPSLAQHLGFTGSQVTQNGLFHPDSRYMGTPEVDLEVDGCDLGLGGTRVGDIHPSQQEQSTVHVGMEIPRPSMKRCVKVNHSSIYTR